MSKDILTITDHRTEKTYETPVELGPFAPWTCARSRLARKISAS